MTVLYFRKALADRQALPFFLPSKDFTRSKSQTMCLIGADVVRSKLERDRSVCQGVFRSCTLTTSEEIVASGYSESYTPT